jgi:Leucine-rich repeat (LRR) protein
MMDHNVIVQMCYELCNYPSFSLKGAVEMRNLHLSNNNIVSVSADAFNDMRHLSHLDLSNNRIDEIVIGTFNSTNMMTKLFLANNSLSVVPDICSMLHLKQLDLSGNRISGIFSNTFCPLSHLETLDLSNNQITSIQTRAFMQLPHLKYLDLSRNKLRQLPVRWVSPWNIEELHLEQNNFANLDDISLIDLKSNQLNVYLEGNPMVTFKAAHFHSLSGHLTVHLKNMKVENKCVCNCEDDEDDDDDIGNGDNDNNGDNGGFGYFG